MTHIARVFPRRTEGTPDDPLAFTSMQPPYTLPEVDEIHISVAFTWDMPMAEIQAEAWRAVGVPVKMGGPAFNQPGGEFTPGLYTKRGYGWDKNPWVWVYTFELITKGEAEVYERPF